jgi:hypothetical protein
MENQWKYLISTYMNKYEYTERLSTTPDGSWSINTITFYNDAEQYQVFIFRPSQSWNTVYKFAPGEAVVRTIGRHNQYLREYQNAISERNIKIEADRKNLLGTWVASWTNDWRSWTFYDDGTFYFRNIITYMDVDTGKTKFGNVYTMKGNYKIVGQNKIQTERTDGTNKFIAMYNYIYDNNSLHLEHSNSGIVDDLKRDISSREAIKGKRYILIDKKDWQAIGAIFFSTDGLMTITKNNLITETKNYTVDGNLIRTDSSILWFYVAPEGIIIDDGADSGLMYLQIEG